MIGYKNYIEYYITTYFSIIDIINVLYFMSYILILLYNKNDFYCIINIDYKKT
jgi:hypothetical protein